MIKMLKAVDKPALTLSAYSAFVVAKTITKAMELIESRPKSVTNDLTMPILVENT